jgi:glyoxylase-like metal-dependent hydrolase (beta-lactamase superfamily II)
MSDLVVRAYNVGFGDAILVSVPEATNAGAEQTRHLLIDVGNLLAGDGNDDKVFTGVVRDIAERTGGTVDLYVMTHEHLDHVQGLLAAKRAGVELAARHAWLTGSAHPDYYENHPDAKQKKRSVQLALAEAHRMLQAEPDPWLEMMVRNNSAILPPGALGLKTSDYVDHLRAIAPQDQTLYVDNTTDIAGKHPFGEAVPRILAPEEDTSSYYRSLGPTLTTADQVAAGPGPADAPPGLSVPPVGVDPAAFFDLQASRRKNTRRQIMEIDKANNNTSVVLELEWRGWRLLFAGDAELGSWKKMHEQNLIKPVHFVKVSHHGSHNGTYDELFDQLMPTNSPDGRDRHALVSTHDGDWDSVPDTDGTLSLYSSRCTLHDTRTLAHGASLEIRFPG